MRAAVLNGLGEEPTVSEIPEPHAAVGEVRVHVRAASVNGFDAAVAAGYLAGVMEHRFPVVIGKDFAGTVDEIGEGVTGFSVGDRVFGVVAKEHLGDGSFGEFVTVPAAVGVARIPDGVGFDEAAALGLAGTAAHDAVVSAGIGEESVVLVAGATGGVGQQVVQLAAAAGAEVIATVRTDAAAAAVRELGASSTVDYTGDLDEQVRSSHAGGVDVVFHFAGDPAVLAGLIAPGGALVSTIVLDPSQFAAEGVRLIPVYAQPTSETLERIADAHVAGRTRVSIQRTYPLDESIRALADFSGGTLGKLVVTLD